MRIPPTSIPEDNLEELGKSPLISILAKADEKTANFIKAFFF
jgi:hypothetical protein